MTFYILIYNIIQYKNKTGVIGMKSFKVNTWKVLTYSTMIMFLSGMYLFFIKKDIESGTAVLSVVASIYMLLVYMNIDIKATYKKLTLVVLIAVVLLTITILSVLIFASSQITTIKIMGILIFGLIYIDHTAKLKK